MSARDKLVELILAQHGKYAFCDEHDCLADALTEANSIYGDIAQELAEKLRKWPMYEKGRAPWCDAADLIDPEVDEQGKD